MPKIRELRLARGRQQKELGNAIGTDEPMMCRFENYKCLPIPSMMSLLIKELNCSIDDLYEPHELYSNIKTSTQRKPKVAQTYHLTVDLPTEAKEFLREHLKELGYKDITDWVNRCYEKLKRQYAELQKNSPNQNADKSN